MATATTRRLTQRPAGLRTGYQQAGLCLRTPGRVGLAGLSLALLVGAGVVLAPMDGYGGWLASCVAAKEDTVYAVGYTDVAFKKVGIGMTDREVAVLLGEPLEIYTVEGELDLLGWRYSRSATGASYHVRAILFRDGRVTEVFREFYLD